MSSGTEADSIEREYAPSILSRISGARKGLLYDGLFDDGTCQILLAMMQERRDVALREGRLHGRTVGLEAAHAPADALSQIARRAADQSNTSVVFGRHLIMKMFRRVEHGPNPDVEIGDYLTRANFMRVPPLKGTLTYVTRAGGPADIAMLQEFVVNQGNGWQVTIDSLARYFDHVVTLPYPNVSVREAHEYLAGGGPVPAAVSEAITTDLAMADVLGRRTGELHVQLAESTDPAFAPEGFTAADLASTAVAMQRQADEQLQMLGTALPSLEGRARELARQVVDMRDDLVQRFAGLTRVENGGLRLRCHGDYHLGQVLVTEGDIVILDFEGEPARPLAERRTKCSPLRDVAGMLRSFSYVALTALNAATLTRPEDVERLAPWAELWETWVRAVYLRSYLAATADSGILPVRSDDIETVLQAFIANKALYELGYELNNRPDWVQIPLAGLLRLHSPLHA
jgi:maltose alpha-D-glucosyltransferase/alpha-amylase